MGYYQGDYYARGMRGDPGVFSFIGGIAKRVVSALVPGGGVITSLARKTAPVTLATRGATKLAELPIVSRGIALAKRYPGAAIGAGALAAAGAGALAARGLGGRAPMALGRRGRRRMRVTNVRALRRAIHRCQGFARLAKRVLHFCAPRPPRGRPIFRVRRKKRV